MTKQPKQTEQQPPSFEDSLTRLEKLVAELEEGELPLDEAIGRFEEGLKLVKTCRSRLEEAELKVKKLMEEEAEKGDGKE